MMTHHGMPPVLHMKTWLRYKGGLAVSTGTGYLSQTHQTVDHGDLPRDNHKIVALGDLYLERLQCFARYRRQCLLVLFPLFDYSNDLGRVKSYGRLGGADLDPVGRDSFGIARGDFNQVLAVSSKP